MVNSTPKIAKNWKMKTLKIYREHKDWNATEVRGLLISWLGENRTPGKSSIQKEWARLIEKYGEIKDMDLPWNMGLMDKQAIPPEAVPDILTVQDWSEKEHPEVLGFIKDEPITIRQSIWIVRLRGVANLLRDSKAKGMNKNLDISSWLWQWSNAYAQYEIIWRLSSHGQPLDTMRLDKAMWSGAWPVSTDNSVDLYFEDGHIEIAIEKDGE